MNIYEYQLNNVKHLSIKVLKEALKEANDKNYISKLRGLKRGVNMKWIKTKEQARQYGIDYQQNYKGV